MDRLHNQFPNKETVQSLTLFYLEQKDLSELSPEEFLDLYIETYRALSEKLKNIPSSQLR